MNADPDFVPRSCDGPSLVLGGLSIWVLEKALAETSEWYDGNVLRVRAVCSATGATVTAPGPLLSSNGISHLLTGMEAMHKWAINAVEIVPTEPNLAVTLTRDARGGLRIDVRITPDHMTQEHRFFFDADLTYLPAPIVQCREILRAFPAVGGLSHPVRVVT